MAHLTQKNQWFNQMYIAHHGTLLNWFKQKLQHQHQAEDLSHEVFYRILKHEQFQKIQEPKAWLLGIAKHVVIDFWRKQQIERLYLETLSEMPEQFYPSVEQELSIRESLYQVHCILEQLPARTAKVFLLSQLDGLNYVDIATELNISESTVKRDMKTAFLACIQLSQSD
ncbi:sigma-70 family RNA polymerase sigma factor [Acinetobacter qingfengensis]|uniref:RNA polymerase subunit sigma-24 n=1 Tax=Acinetobacter qingfengensis TaxID=1262585 RepID=A0A1E7RER6_9GAMM|nr:sigma-70 family RNA polymerase sigma factor [Acinetobacter qingfengensis]KAA8735665.1 sigma-70 family RNA polymerase sigma factor [Acinetobacter qingfengensis]OEY97889.1 RNA polymerase subunit sigma-24 [Acinetobacter qingfengensis]